MRGWRSYGDATAAGHGISRPAPTPAVEETPSPAGKTESGTLPPGEASSTVRAHGSTDKALSGTLNGRSHGKEVAGRGGDEAEAEKLETKASPLTYEGTRLG